MNWRLFLLFAFHQSICSHLILKVKFPWQEKSKMTDSVINWKTYFLNIVCLTITYWLDSLTENIRASRYFLNFFWLDFTGGSGSKKGAIVGNMYISSLPNPKELSVLHRSILFTTRAKRPCVRNWNEFPRLKPNTNISSSTPNEGRVFDGSQYSGSGFTIFSDKVLPTLSLFNVISLTGYCILSLYRSTNARHFPPRAMVLA